METRIQFTAMLCLQVLMISERRKNMNENYEAPKMEIIEFETEDVITTSGGLGEGGVNEGDDD